MKINKRISCFIIFVLPYWLHAQSYTLQLQGNNADVALFSSLINHNYPSFLDCVSELKKNLYALYEQGYLTASVPNITLSDTKIIADVEVGKQYKFAVLKNGNIPAAIINSRENPSIQFTNKPISPKRVAQFFEQIVSYFENNGYPFSSVQLDSIIIQSEQLHATLNIQKGPLTKIDSIILNDDAKISKNYVQHYLGIHEGALYDERKIKTLSTHIRESSFLQEAYPWRIRFNVANTKLNLYLNNKAANRADVLIGLLPNNAEIGGKFMLTGDVKLAFTNALGAGEQFSLNWQNLQYKSPRTDIHFSYPYVFNSPLGITTKFEFYKKDTTFRTVNGEVGLQYLLNANQHVKLYYQIASSRLLSVNTAMLSYSKTLPPNADFKYNTIGIEFNTQRVNYKRNPRKGYQLLINTNFSKRNLLKNAAVESTYDVTEGKYFSYLYDSIALKTYKYNITAAASYYIPLTKRIVLANKYYGGILYSTQQLFKNELFQIGGYKLLRGFDEGSIFVNNYHVLTVEPRYLLSQNSYFFLFTDLASLTANYSSIHTTYFAYSTGVGTSFETKGGLFNISYALGGTQQIPLQFRNSKIHFGYISFF